MKLKGLTVASSTANLLQHNNKQEPSFRVDLNPLTRKNSRANIKTIG